MSTVFVDVDTQLDFLLPAGALYSKGSEAVVAAAARLNRYAAAHSLPIISTTDAHAEDDGEFGAWPPHCILGTLGQRKPESTLLAGHVVVPAPPAAWNGTLAAQMILEKTTTDAFAGTRMQALLDALRPGAFVLYGVVTDVCVAHAARGLLATGKPVAIVEDAIQAFDKHQAETFLKEFQAAGGTLTTLAAVGA